MQSDGDPVVGMGIDQGALSEAGRTLFVLRCCGAASQNHSGTVLDFRHAPLSGDRSGVPRRGCLDGHRHDFADCSGQGPPPATGCS